MVKLTESDIQTTKEGFMKIYNAYRDKGITIQEAYYRTVDYCHANGLSPSYTSLESFKTSSLYEKVIKK